MGCFKIALFKGKSESMFFTRKDKRRKQNK